MKKKIAILGSTGSIGKILLDLLFKDKKNIEIKLLTANKNYKELYKQAIKFNVKNLIITDKSSYQALNKINKNKIDYVMSSIVGLDGLDPTLKIIKFTKKIAIANK